MKTISRIRGGGFAGCSGTRRINVLSISFLDKFSLPRNASATFCQNLLSIVFDDNQIATNRNIKTNDIIKTYLLNYSILIEEHV